MKDPRITPTEDWTRELTEAGSSPSVPLNGVIERSVAIAVEELELRGPTRARRFNLGLEFDALVLLPRGHSDRVKIRGIRAECVLLKCVGLGL